jgi:superoxide oxidase
VRASDRYDALARTFHWVIALLIAGMFLTGWTRRAAGQGSPERVWWLSAHTSLGLLVLVLSVGRLAWRLYSPPPLDGTRIAQLAAKAGHAVLYICTIGLLLTGLTRAMAGVATLSSSASQFRPGLAVRTLSWALAALAHGELVMNLLLALTAGHALAALWHQFLLHDDTLRRMV